MVPYDEFSMFHENAEEFGLPFDGPPTVQRVSTDLGDSRRLSSLVWGEGSPELVFLHGGAQNAHTWDTVALALGRPLVAIDLPGHGHSDGGRQGSLELGDNAEDVATVIRTLAPDAVAVIGMSLGGITALALTDDHPELVRSVVLVDITPGVTADKAQAITAFVQGPESFASFDDILARTIEHNPTRTVSSLRRGILHNAVQRDDGSWVWRYARHRSLERPAGGGAPDYAALWDAWRGSRCRCCSSAGCSRSRSWTTTTRPSCSVASRQRESSGSPTPATASKATRPSSSPDSSTTSRPCECGDAVEPGELVRVADGVDAPDPAVLDGDAHGGVELAADVDPDAG